MVCPNRSVDGRVRPGELLTVTRAMVSHVVGHVFDFGLIFPAPLVSDGVLQQVVGVGTQV